jgi:hypothetical protein
VWEGLARFAAMPEWLAALDDPTRVQTALDRVLPRLGRARLSGVRLKPGAWTARCTLVPDGAEQAVHLAGTILPPGHGEPESTTPSGDRPGNDGWRCWLPELRLQLVSKTEQDEALPALGLLTDPERAGSLLETAIRVGAPAYRNLQILAATPKVMRYSPGSRCTVLYRLALPAQPQAATWPDMVVAKTYHRSDKGRIAWEGMRALWRSPLAGSGAVAIAEPLAWLPELKILVQGPIPQERTLKELLLAALLSDATRSQHELRESLAKTAAGLVELHHCGAPSAQGATWEEELAEVRQVLGRLTAVVPDLDGAADPFLSDLERLAARIAADPALPAHRSFRPAQVLLHNSAIGFIDFDGFCQAEPALDIALFRTTTQDLAMSVLPAGRPLQARLAIADDLCEYFLSCYQELAPISRERVALWEALDLLTNVLHSWTKAKPARLARSLALLGHHAISLRALTGSP